MSQIDRVMSVLLAVGDTFSTILKLKRACSTFAIQYSFEYLVVKWDRKCYIIKCKEENCAWRLTASIPRDSAKVAISFCFCTYLYSYQFTLDMHKHQSLQFLPKLSTNFV